MTLRAIRIYRQREISARDVSRQAKIIQPPLMSQRFLLSYI